MPRQAAGYWDERKRHYYAKLGEPSPTTGRPTPVMLRHENGHPIAFNETGAVAASVRRLLAEREAARLRADGPLVGDVCKQYLAWLAEEKAAARTIKGHYYQLMRFCRFVHAGVPYSDRKAASIEPDDLWRIKKEHARLKAQGKPGWGGQRNLFASVLACWRWAARPVEGREPKRIFPANSLAGIVRPKPRAEMVEKLVDWRAARKLLRFARAYARRPSRFRRQRTKTARRLKALCLALIAETGARPFEAYALRRDEIRWDDGVIVVDPTRTKPRGKDRRIAISPRLLQALRLVCDLPGAHPTFVFVPAWSKHNGEPKVREMDVWFREELRPAAVEASVPIPEDMTLYWLRHDWQTAGLEVETVEGVSEAAGNSPKVLLSTYAHKKNRRIKEVHRKVQALRRKEVG